MNTIFKVVIEHNSNGEVRVMTNTDELVEVIIKDKVTQQDVEEAHNHNDNAIDGINAAYEALNGHLNEGAVESDFEDELIFAFKALSCTLGKGYNGSWKDPRADYENHVGLVRPIAEEGIRKKFDAALKNDDALEVLDTHINDHIGINPEDEFHVMCLDGIGYGYCEEKNLYVIMRYPRIEELTEEQLQEAREYRGHNEDIDETDVMLLYGKALYFEQC